MIENKKLNKNILIITCLSLFLLCGVKQVSAADKVLDDFLLSSWDQFVLQYEDKIDFKLDYDHDSYANRLEIMNGYSPFNKDIVDIINSDVDKDGLSDYMEIVLKTNPLEKDSDGDTYLDGLEFDYAYNPNNPSDKAKLVQKIEINLADQELSYLVDGYNWKTFSVSSGKASTPTNPGTYYVVNKIKKAWSSYGLWMPYWLGLDRGGIGIHELPIWPNGYREGEDHLGIPVSHGCIRLGTDSAAYIYERIEPGVEVYIY